MRQTNASPSATTSATRVARRAVTSLTRTAPARARRATVAFAVSIESGSPPRPSRTGSKRASSSSAVTGAAPGRVDSPPTSTTAAPSSSSLRPWSIAVSGSTNRPPSEKLSGVTLSTPITDGRGQRSSNDMRALMGGSVAPSDLRARIDRYGHTCVEQWPARAAERHRLRDRHGDHHARDLHALLGLKTQDEVKNHPAKASAEARPRHLHSRRHRHVVPSSEVGKMYQQDGRTAPSRGGQGSGSSYRSSGRSSGSSRSRARSTGTGSRRATPARCR
jgi:hypothetical protein